eukprot:CAMPEP_0115033322 /NCGR_PEP_ID=MMETSP0216-20121206/39783_1 /TAXON_ID=223996 /ORGANISM="Protocruzia adherens, Strain Boccale" /LENGTH=629 /DNA_ID=CAMNT_0002411587 /DNA_START=249 /DNA_END=2134 /DNA_ORIENTATION=+
MASSELYAFRPHGYTKFDIGIKLTKFLDPCRILKIDHRNDHIALKSPRKTKSKNDVANKSHEVAAHLILKAQLVGNGNILEEQTLSTSINMDSEMGDIVTFATEYKDLPLNTTMTFSFWTTDQRPEEPPLGSTTFHLFNASKRLRKGEFLFRLYPQQFPDLSIDSKTSGFSTDENFLEMYKNLADLSDLKKHAGQNSDHSKLKLMQKIESNLLDLIISSQFAYIEVALLDFRTPLLYDEKQYDKRPLTSISSSTSKRASSQAGLRNIVTVLDQNTAYNIGNPVVEKYYKLSRVIDDINAKDLKPSGQEFRRLQDIITKPDFISLSEDDKFLLWRYRYSLLDKKDALTKFLHAVNWEKTKEEDEAISLLVKWVPIELSDALHLLSAYFSANGIYQKENVNNQKIHEVRIFAVKCLYNHAENDIEDILLQLVQALRYEDFIKSPLAEFLISRAKTRLEFASTFFWYLYVEVEANSKRVSQWYERVIQMFFDQLRESKEGRKIIENIEGQRKLTSKLNEMCKGFKSGAKKIEKRREIFKNSINPGGAYELSSLKEPLPLPINPNVYIHGAVIERCILFTSAKAPARLVFNVTTGGPSGPQTPYPVIFKEDDDLRQDQLVLQIIALMDNLLKT